ncbi:BTAD domain-containing putative transcriptional regulator [Streptomyces sp. PAN_FS17]|uniref:BTAD domain-containing putative transcriptional regulator n=1 Tax=Streptomyces sp. PAN_FS17 TaxID=1855351 RepID=UPI00089880E3|nr:BTAD domain-containing putative transcriptional regulator [Streptomyces sp. PAN_FS17]SED32023.1 DNA-binding transcriptional activator of the SARP family [Streptomyces sp. PAN_FS17]
MEFKVLGPLEVVSDGRSLPLGGVKQRAVLALLLLHANQVVATSQLLDALWPEDARPVTARKMVQNAVWGLRALLESGDGEARDGTPPQLLTRAPGYVLRLDPERLDATRFERAVAAGRARLDAGEAAEAAVLLGDALAEWRGSALSDLVEQGVEWAELTALRQLRLDAMEDRFEAELACGRHHAVLGELTSLAEAEPLRERLCGQLMLALYRCGRQAEALSVFSKVRQALVEEYGLEPSASLQNLQQRILRHDRALASPTEDRTEPDAPNTSDAQDAGAPRRDPAAAESHREAPARDTAVATPEPGQVPALAPADQGTTMSASCDAPESGDPTSVPPPAPGATDTGDHSRASYGPADTGAVAERRDVCVLVVCTESAGDATAMESEQLDTSLHDAVTALTESVETRSGTIVGSMGGLCAALFGLRSDRPEASLNAVRAAFEARERLAARAGMVMRAVVISGKAIVRHDPHDPRAAVSVVGTLLDKAHGLLTGVPKGELYVSDDVARDTDAWVRYDETTRTADGTVGIRKARSLHPAEPAGHGTDTRRRPELALLENLLEYSRHHDVPCMLTVLGDHGVGKTSLLARFERRVVGDFDEVRVLRPRVPKDGYDAAGLATALLEASAPPRHRAPLDPPEQRLRALVRSAVESDVDAARLLRVLCPAPHSGRPADGAEVLAAWREVIEHAARHRPLVLCLDDLHLANDVVLDWVESLGGAGAGPLLVVACGHSDLLLRRPLWGSGHEHASRLTLPRLREPAAPTQRRTLPFPDCRPWRQEERHRVSGRFHGGFRGRGAEPVDVRPRRRAM